YVLVTSRYSLFAYTTLFRSRFPRFHQWRAVNKIAVAAAEEGPGHNYLIQHSAGSGKTDSIAWTAHRLASLHNSEGEKVFDTVFRSEEHTSELQSRIDLVCRL